MVYKPLKEQSQEAFNNIPDAYTYQCNCMAVHKDKDTITVCPACHNTMCPVCSKNHGYDKQGKTDLCHDPRLIKSHIDSFNNYHMNDGNKGIQSKYIIQGLLKSSS